MTLYQYCELFLRWKNDYVNKISWWNYSGLTEEEDAVLDRMLKNVGIFEFKYLTLTFEQKCYMYLKKFKTHILTKIK